MRKEDMKFAYLEPEKELYKAYTTKDNRRFHRCVFGEQIGLSMTYRLLYFRERGWAWKGQITYAVCAKHYKEVTDKELKG